MADFDPSSATPVADNQTTGFDPATAAPVEERSLGAEQYAPNTLTPDEEGGAMKQFEQEHPYISGAVKAFAGLVPTSLEQVKQLATLPMPSADVEKNIRESEQLGKAWSGEYGPEEQAKSIVGTGLQALPLSGILFP